MIKPVEYNGEKLLVAFWWPDANTGYCFLYTYTEAPGTGRSYRKEALAAGVTRRNPKDAGNRKIARLIAFGRMMKSARESAALPPEVLDQIEKNFRNRGKQ